MNFVPDGKIHRVKGASGKSAWYVSHGSWGAWGDWATGEKNTFTNGNKPDFDKRRIFRSIHKAEELKTQLRVARECWELWENIDETFSHPYLSKKKVDSFGCRGEGSDLYLPMHDQNGVVWNLQKILESGQKFFQKGGRKKGCFFSLDKLDKPLFICEGYATGASIKMAADVSVVVAFDAGNLVPVVKSLRSVYKNVPFYVAADDDRWKPDVGNAGLREAEKCLPYGCRVVTPRFNKQLYNFGPTDFNDLHVVEGIGAVQDQIMGVLI